MDVYDLRGKKANKKDFCSYMRSKKPSLIFLNGHGDSRVVTGYDNKVIIDPEDTPSKSIMYARSCDAATTLGPILVQKGLRSFIGYMRKFVLYYDPQSMLKPDQDSMAKLFLESSNLVVTTLIKENTVAEAHNRSRNVMQKNLKYMLSSEANLEEKYAAPAMWSNMTSQVALGDINATI
jgi:CRISPR/Cas system CMR-associated protein Cmr5 small subunit